MCRGEDLNPRRDLAGDADGDRGDVEDDRVDVDGRPVADADVPVFARERWPHDDARTNMAQHSRSFASRSSHAAGSAPLKHASSSCTSPNSAAFSASSAMYTAAQHPFSHLAHVRPIPNRMTSASWGVHRSPASASAARVSCSCARAGGGGAVDRPPRSGGCHASLQRGSFAAGAPQATSTSTSQPRA